MSKVAGEDIITSDPIIVSITRALEFDGYVVHCAERESRLSLTVNTNEDNIKDQIYNGIKIPVNAINN